MKKEIAMRNWTSLQEKISKGGGEGSNYGCDSKKHHKVLVSARCVFGASSQEGVGLMAGHRDHILPGKIEKKARR